MVAHVGLIIVHHSPPIVTPAVHGLCLLSTPVFREGKSLFAWVESIKISFNCIPEN
jgi:hypothetical protein